MRPDPDMIPLDSVDWPAISASWADQFPPNATLLGVSLFGDLFVSDVAGAVFMFAVTSGELKQIACCREEFEWDLAQPEKRAVWLMVPLVAAARAAGLRPGRGECLVFQT